MIRVTVVTDGSGVLEEVTATGHSFAFAQGENIVCAAATILLRSAARLLDSDKNIRVSGGIGLRGQYEFKVKVLEDGKNEYARAVGDYLKQGIADLQREFPGECALTAVERNRR